MHGKVCCEWELHTVLKVHRFINSHVYSIQMICRHTGKSGSCWYDQPAGRQHCQRFSGLSCGTISLLSVDAPEGFSQKEPDFSVEYTPVPSGNVLSRSMEMLRSTYIYMYNYNPRIVDNVVFQLVDHTIVGRQHCQRFSD